MLLHSIVNHLLLLRKQVCSLLVLLSSRLQRSAHPSYRYRRSRAIVQRCTHHLPPGTPSTLQQRRSNLLRHLRTQTLDCRRRYLLPNITSTVKHHSTRKSLLQKPTLGFHHQNHIPWINIDNGSPSISKKYFGYTIITLLSRPWSSRRVFSNGRRASMIVWHSLKP